MATLSPVKKSTEGKTTPLYMSPVKTSKVTPVRVKQSEFKASFIGSPMKHSEAKIARSFSTVTGEGEQIVAVSRESPVKRAGKGVQHLYRVIQKSTGAVGGYGHNGPVYGEVTMGTFQKVVDALCLHTEFDASSTFIDIGSGLGKPSMHVALNPGVKHSFGIELEELRWQLSMHNLRFVTDEVPEMRKNVVYFGHMDATEMGDFEGVTHVYMFDVGFPPAALVSLANSFNRSKCVKALVSFQRPDKVISVYGFGVDLVDQIQTRMNGSSEKHTAYIYSAKPRGVTAKHRHQLQLSNFLVEKEGSASPPKKCNPEKAKKTCDTFAKLLLEDYDSWLVDNGIIGAPGERVKRSFQARTRVLINMSNDCS